MSPRTSLALAELAVAYKGRGVLAFDLAGQEKDYPAKAHRAAFQLVLENNVNSTVHAGEAFGPASIAQALHYCGAHRIGHGTRLREDRDLLRYVTTTASRSRCACRPTCRRAPSRTSASIRSALLPARACASRSTPTTA